MSNFLAFFLSVDPPSSVLIYRILATLHSLSLIPLLIHFFQHYEVISVPVIQSEGQQKSLPASNRLLSEAERVQTPSVLVSHSSITDNPFLSLCASKPINLSTSLSLYISYYLFSLTSFPFLPSLFSPGLQEVHSSHSGLLTLLLPGKPCYILRFSIDFLILAPVAKGRLVCLWE